MKTLLSFMIALLALGLTAGARAQTCSCPSTNYLNAANSSNTVAAAVVTNVVTNGTAMVVNGPSGGFGIAVGAGLHGIDATSAGGDAVYGSSGGNGIEGSSTSQSASGMYGHNSSNGFGIAGRCTATTNTCSAVYGQNLDTNPNAYAGFFDGNVYITGGITCHNGGTCFLDSKELRELHTRLDALEQYRGRSLAGGGILGLFGLLAGMALFRRR